MSEQPNRPTVIEPGQMWVDNDIRSKGAGEFTVQEVYEDTDGTFAIVRRHATGSVSRIRTDRLLDPKHRKRGYSYIGMARMKHRTESEETDHG